MREESKVFFEKIWAWKLEINDPKLPRKRKIPCSYEEGEVLAEFVFTTEEHYQQMSLSSNWYGCQMYSW